MTTPSSAFLQPHATRVAARADAAITLLHGTKIGVWRIDGERQRRLRSDTYRVVLHGDDIRARLTIYDTPALHLGSYGRRIVSLAQMLTTIEHPGVAIVIDADIAADGRPYIVTNLDRGATLSDILADGEPLDTLPALTILRAICAPLMAAHDAGIVHGSLCAEHVFLVDDADRGVKLLDWGIERALFDEARRAGIEAPPCVVCAAPEEDIGIVSPKTDAYALGVIAYQLLFGCAPFEGSTLETLRAMQREVPEPPSHLADIPEDLHALVLQLLAVDPRERPSIHAAAVRLGAIYQAISTPAAVVPPAPAPAAAAEPAPAPALVVEQANPDVPEDFETDATTEVSPRAPRRGVAVVSTVAAFAAAAALYVKLRPFDDDAPPRVSAAATKVATAPAILPPAPPPRVLTPPTPPSPRVRVAAREVPPARKTVPVSTTPKVAARKAPARRPSGDTKDLTEVRNELLTRYQRVGRALLQLQRERGVVATSELLQEFKAFKIEPALATAPSRAEAAAVLGDLEKRIERQQGVDVADACLKNPIAAGCQ